MHALLLLMILVGPRGAAAVTHTLRNFNTASSGVPNFPEFVNVGMIDGVQTDRYDSNTRRAEPKQDWMIRATADDPQYWERDTQIFAGYQQVDKVNIENLNQRFNQTGGVHLLQMMFGCDWDDETDEINGYHQYAFDGADFISYDLKTETWIAVRPEAVLTKQRVEQNRGLMARIKHSLTQICIDELKKVVSYGRSSLMRTELPVVSLLQKTSSSPVSCLATGFYPDRASLMWRREGEELHEEVEHGELLPNHDGTFQLSVDLDLSSVAPEDWSRYDCVFQLAGVEEDKVTRLDKDAVQSNRVTRLDKDAVQSNRERYVVVAVVVLALVLGVLVGFFVHRQKKANRPPSPVSNPEVLEVLKVQEVQEVKEVPEVLEELNPK